MFLSFFWQEAAITTSANQFNQYMQALNNNTIPYKFTVKKQADDSKTYHLYVKKNNLERAQYFIQATLDE